MKLTPRWICPRCHIALRGPTAFCPPCRCDGNNTARFEDGSIVKAGLGADGQPIRRIG